MRFCSLIRTCFVHVKLKWKSVVSDQWNIFDKITQLKGSNISKVVLCYSSTNSYSSCKILEQMSTCYCILSDLGYFWEIMQQHISARCEKYLFEWDFWGLAIAERPMFLHDCMTKVTAIFASMLVRIAYRKVVKRLFSFRCEKNGHKPVQTLSDTSWSCSLYETCLYNHSSSKQNAFPSSREKKSGCKSRLWL